MRIIHIEFSKLGTGMSGGETCLVELVKQFRERGIENLILTTDNARAEWEALGLEESPLVHYRVIESHAFEKKSHPIVSYVHRTRQAMPLVRDLEIRDDDVLICNNDFFPNSIPFRTLARKSNKTTLIYWLRMVAPPLFSGFEGHFTGRKSLPSLRYVHFWLAQLLYGKLLQPRGTLLLQNAFAAPLLKKRCPNNPIHVLSRYSGSTYVPAPGHVPEKRYDLAWMGRFHPQKGLFEVVDILARIRQVKPDVSLLLIGGGNPKIERRFREECERRGVWDGINYQGYISDSKKFEWLEKARLFLMTSFYEGHPNVVVESMSAGLPVIAYDLPFHSSFERGMVRVPVLDNAAAADAIVTLLENKDRRAHLAEEARAHSREFSWDEVADEILGLAGESDTPKA